jgi:hypothetical protein
VCVRHLVDLLPLGRIKYHKNLIRSSVISPFSNLKTSMEITLVRVKITLMRVQIELERVKITLMRVEITIERVF